MRVKVDRRRASGERTRKRILMAAQRLFADRGLDGTYVRDIAVAARADLSMINYHFGSKEGLYGAVIKFRADDLNAKRLEALDAVLETAASPPALEEIVNAYVGPWLAMRDSKAFGGIAFARVIVREIVDPNERKRGIIEEAYDEVARRFIAAFAVAMPAATHADCCWAYHFALGTLLYTLASTGRLETLSFGECNSADVHEVLERMVPFIAAGIRASVQRGGARPPRRVS